MRKFKVVDEDNLYFEHEGELAYTNAHAVGLKIGNELVVFEPSEVKEVI